MSIDKLIHPLAEKIISDLNHPDSPRYAKCPKCNEDVRIPDVPVRDNGLLRCTAGHLFSRRAAGRPTNDTVAATGHVHIRTTLPRKGHWVRAAKPKTLAAWATEILDKASGYESPEQ